MNETLLHFEASTGLGPTFAARLLGVAYPTYAQYRSGRRELPTYHSRHIEVLLLLSPSALSKIIERHSRG
jgi:DNA-binding transcriptional regulator YdaS (Cro superfamily)